MIYRMGLKRISTNALMRRGANMLYDRRKPAIRETLAAKARWSAFRLFSISPSATSASPSTAPPPTAAYADYRH
jgi:hypothetical protein